CAAHDVVEPRREIRGELLLVDADSLRELLVQPGFRTGDPVGPATRGLADPARGGTRHVHAQGLRRMASAVTWDIRGGENAGRCHQPAAQTYRIPVSLLSSAPIPDRADRDSDPQGSASLRSKLHTSGFAWRRAPISSANSCNAMRGGTMASSTRCTA